jgi:SAM-dependent methyltransferase
MTAPQKSTFAHSTSADYDRFMGRYSEQLAPHFADLAGIQPPMSVLDVGCGPGALTRELVRRLGAESVTAADPSPVFVADCAARYPGVTVKSAFMEVLPFADNTFDATLTQLVLHFVEDPPKGVAEMMRVTRPGGKIAGSVWAMPGGMQMLQSAMSAIVSMGLPSPPPERVVRFGALNELKELFESAGLVDVEEREIDVASTYTDFDDYWAAIQSSQGPVAQAMSKLSADEMTRFRDELFEQVGRPAGAFALNAKARAAVGTVP